MEVIRIEVGKRHAAQRDPYIAKDPWASRKPSMAIGLKHDGKFLRGSFDIVLARGF